MKKMEWQKPNVVTLTEKEIAEKVEIGACSWTWCPAGSLYW